MPSEGQTVRLFEPLAPLKTLFNNSLGPVTIPLTYRRKPLHSSDPYVTATKYPQAPLGFAFASAPSLLTRHILPTWAWHSPFADKVGEAAWM